MNIKKPLSKNLQKRIKEECAKELSDMIKQFNYEANLQLIYVLHFKYGFGEKRLIRFMKDFIDMQWDTREFYEASDDDILFIYDKKLKEAGIDFDKIIEEAKK